MLYGHISEEMFLLVMVDVIQPTLGFTVPKQMSLASMTKLTERERRATEGLETEQFRKKAQSRFLCSSSCYIFCPNFLYNGW